MNFDTRWIDVSQNLATGQQPVAFFERELLYGSDVRGDVRYNAAEVARTGTYWVPTSDLLVSPVEWSVTRSGSIVRVPVCSYSCPTHDAAFRILTGVQLGIVAANSLRQHTDQEIEKVTIVAGHECHDLKQSGIRYYMGFVFKVKDD